jgi:hypothetical protein
VRTSNPINLILFVRHRNLLVTVINRTNAVITYLKALKGCTRTDQLRNEDIRNELDILLLYLKTNTEYRHEWKIHLQRNRQTRIPLKAYKYCLSGRRGHGKPKKKVEVDVTVLEAGTGDSSNPRSDDDVDNVTTCLDTTSVFCHNEMCF